MQAQNPDPNDYYSTIYIAKECCFPSSVCKYYKNIHFHNFVFCVSLRLLMFSASSPTNNHIIENAFEIEIDDVNMAQKKDNNHTVLFRNNKTLGNIPRKTHRLRALTEQRFVVYCYSVTNRQSTEEKNNNDGISFCRFEFLILVNLSLPLRV